MKKFLSVLLAVMMVLVFTACSQTEQATEAEQEQAESTEAVAAETETTEAEAEPEVVETPAWEPEQNFKALIGYGAGGSTDSAMRPLMSVAEEIMGKTITVENVSGGSGSIAFSNGFQGDHDGYTLIIGAETPALYDAYDLIDYTYNDVTMICVAADTSNFIYVNIDSPYNTVEELFNAEKANPGSILKTASGSVGVNATINAIFSYCEDLNFQTYTSDSSSSAVVTIMGGFADWGLGSWASLKDYVASGDIKVLCSVTPERIQDDIPSITEYYPEMSEYLPINAFYTISVPNDVDQAVVDYLIGVFTEAYNSAEYQEALTNLTLNPLGLFGDDAKEYVDAFRYKAMSVLTSTGAVAYTMADLGY